MSPKSQAPFEPKLRHINLLKIFDEINLQFFNGMICGGIGWKALWIGNDGDATLAVCYTEERYILINTALRDKRVPLWFVKMVIYHEMLHIHLGPQQFERDGFAYPHSDRFQILEKQHPEYVRAIQFEQTKLPYILDQWKELRAYKRAQKKKVP